MRSYNIASLGESVLTFLDQKGSKLMDVTHMATPVPTYIRPQFESSLFVLIIFDSCLLEPEGLVFRWRRSGFRDETESM